MGKHYDYSTTLADAQREIKAHERLKQAYLDTANKRNWSNDHFVTLTFKPSYINDEAKRSTDAQHFLKRLDYSFWGNAAKKRGKKLYRYGIFELNKSGQLHIHMLLENPGSIRILESRHEETIIDTWMRMDCSGKCIANKVLPINRTPEYLNKYLHKHTRASNSLMADPILWHLPIDSSQ